MPVPKCPIPNPQPSLRRLLGCLLLLCPPLFARGPEAPVRIPLQNVGFQPVSNEFLLNGSSMFTVHYVDDKHLLLTFGVHRLIPRLPDEPNDDLDRIVDAVLLELPTGKPVARTAWHLHDHAQYLWNLGHGHFLLRIRDTLTTFAPVANLATAEPFAQQPFLVSSDRRLAALIPSPDGDLLIIESVNRKPAQAKARTSVLGPRRAQIEDKKQPVQIDFLRIHAGDDGGPVQGFFAGVVQSDNAGDVPVTTAGYLSIVDQGRQHWAFDFHSFAGKMKELSPFDSTCPPVPIFVSHSEFIAFGCRRGQTMQEIGGFNMRGEEMWEQGLFGEFIAPSLAYAPSSGRFALSRIMLRNSVVSDQPISIDEISSQTVVVYQTGSGKQLLRADCSPVERAGQNFALSPNGLNLALVHAEALEIYNLPPLTDKDQTDLKLARSSAPVEDNLPIHFTDRPQPTAEAASDLQFEKQSNAQSTVATPTAAPAAPTDATPTRPPGSESETPAQSGAPNPTPAAPPTTNSQSEQRRTPPTLYTLPDEKPPVTAKPTPQ